MADKKDKAGPAGGTRQKASSIVTSTEALSDLFDQKLAPLQQQIAKMDSSVEYVLEELKKVNTLEDKVSELNIEIDSLKYEQHKIKNENSMLKDKLTKLEMYSRKDNIKVLGIKEEKKENVETSVLKAFDEAGLNLDQRSIVRAHRVGAKYTGQNRPILVRLHHYKDKREILKVKATFKTKNITVTEDYPSEVARKRRIILPIFFAALENCPELEPKMLLDTLLLNGNEYNIDNLHTIPNAEVKPENVYTCTKEGVTAYFTKYSPLSNHFPCVFELNGKPYYSVEQYFMYKKALFFKDETTANAILKERDPAINKTQGKFVKNYKESLWIPVAEQHMYDAVFAKFSQNHRLQEFLMGTGHSVIAEANPHDKTWGVGLSLSSKVVFDEDKWQGKNLAGKILQRVRQDLD